MNVAKARGWVMKLVMQYAGAGTPSANRITLLRDADGDGLAETRSVLLAGLHSPFGMALVELPEGPINHHWTRNVIASPDGQKLYVTVGSNSNVAENGIAQELGRAAIWCPTI